YFFCNVPLTTEYCSGTIRCQMVATTTTTPTVPTTTTSSVSGTEVTTLPQADTKIEFAPTTTITTNPTTTLNPQLSNEALLDNLENANPPSENTIPTGPEDI